MDPLHPIDRIRARAAGQLSAAELRELEALLAADPDLARFAEDYASVHLVTEAALEAAPEPARSRAQIGDLDRWIDGDAWTEAAARQSQPGFIRRAAAAIFLLAAVGGLAFFASRLGSKSQPVTLHAIPSAPIVAASADDFERTALKLQSYAPIADGEIAWLSDIEEGRRLAGAAGRPLLLWGIHPTCPFCKKMRETTLLDADVIELVGEYVPVQLDVMVTERYKDLDPFDKGFPIFELLGPDLTELETFYNYYEPQSFSDKLADGLSFFSKTPLMNWTRVQELARSWTDARRAEVARDFGTAQKSYEALVISGEDHGLSQAAREGVERIAAAAWTALDAASKDVAPVEVLAAAAHDFLGTPYAADFEALLRSTERLGAMPEMHWD